MVVPLEVDDRVLRVVDRHVFHRARVHSHNTSSFIRHNIDKVHRKLVLEGGNWSVGTRKGHDVLKQLRFFDILQNNFPVFLVDKAVELKVVN